MEKSRLTGLDSLSIGPEPRSRATDLKEPKIRYFKDYQNEH